jgi:hypothetical protein
MWLMKRERFIITLRRVERKLCKMVFEYNVRKDELHLRTLYKNLFLGLILMQLSNDHISSYKERISKLRVSVDNVRKIVFGRITTMTFHPSCDKTIICAGDSKGNLGFWNVVSKEYLRFSPSRYG